MKKIVFVQSDPLITCTRLAKGLKERGYKTALICLFNPNYDSIKDAYDDIISIELKTLSARPKNFMDLCKSHVFNLKLFKIMNRIRKLNADYFVCVAAPHPTWLCALTRLLTRKKVIFFPYDVNYFRYYKTKDYLAVGIPRIELLAEKYCYRHCDGFIFKGNEWGVLKKEFKINKPAISIIPPVLDENIVKKQTEKLSKKDEEFHIVHVGFVETKTPSCLGITPISENIARIIAQKMHFHVYPNSQVDYLRNSEEYKELRKSPYFHIHQPVKSSEISKEISKYDAASWINYYDFKIFKKEWINTGMGNRFSTFVEAGIPIIVAKDASKYIYAMSKKYHIDIGVDFDNLESIKDELKKFDKKKALKGLNKARQELSLVNAITKLEEFFKRFE